jgi:hypothetical protein
MQGHDIDNLLAILEPSRHGWTAQLPDNAQFHGQRVILRIQTESIPSGSMPPPTTEMLELARAILLDIDRVLRDGEREFAAYHQEYDPDAVAQADAPRIWIDMDALLDDGPTRWALVVGRKGSEDYGTHIEFDGTRLIDIWSGD